MGNPQGDPRDTIQSPQKEHGEKETARNRLSRLRFRATELEVKIDTELFDEARVVACTLVGSANRVLTNRNFTTLFIDEPPKHSKQPAGSQSAKRIGSS